MTITALAQFESNIDYWGDLLSAAYDDAAVNDDTSLLNSYYDAEAVFYKFKDYTGDSKWDAAAAKAQAAYAGYYVDPNSGNVPGYWSFTHGLTEDWLRNADADAKASCVALSTNAAYHKEVPDTLVELRNPNLSRENAYALMAHINAERCGESRRSRITTLVDNAIDYHINRWCTLVDADFFRPFMGALTARSLIHYYNYIYQDPRIVTALTTMATYAQSSCWISGSSSWNYTDRDLGSVEDLAIAMDLNLLILPYYGWLYWKTGNTAWRDIGDAAFNAGVSVYTGSSHTSGAFLGGTSTVGLLGKHICQNFVWSFDYLTYRANGVAAEGGQNHNGMCLMGVG